MSTAETIYSVRVAYPDYIERSRTQVIALPLDRDGAPVTPSAGGAVRLYDAAGTLITSGTITVVANVATYTLDAAVLPSTLALGHGYREEWDLVLPDGTQRTYRRDAALVLHAAHPTLTDGDLAGVYSDLTRHLASGATTFQPKIDEAWKRILGRLEGQGVFPDHIVSYWSLREVHLELTLYLIALDFARAQGGRWLDLAAQHKREFEMAWPRLRFKRASGADGLTDSDALRPAAKGVTYMNGSPSTSWGGMGGL